MKKCSYRSIDYSMTLYAVLICAVVYPFLALFFFTQPQVDDFCWAVSFRNSGVVNFLLAISEWYQGFTGRYSYIVLMGIFSKVPNLTKHYEIFPLFIVLVWLMSSCILIKTVFGRAHFFATATGAVTLFALYIFTMPEVADFYWVSSSAQYQFGNALAMATITCMLRLSVVVRPRLFVIPAALLLFVVIGTTEMYMLFMVILLIAITLFVFITGQRNRFIWSSLLAVAVLSALLFILAPGNEERGQHLVARHQLFFSLVASMFQAVLWMLRWIWEPLLWLVTLIYAMWLIRHSPRSRVLRKIRCIHLLIVVPCWLAILYGCFFAGFWAMGDIIPPRTLNVVYFIFLIGWFASITIIVTNMQNTHGDLLNVIGKSDASRAIGVIVATVMIASMFNTQRFNVAQADLRSSAHRYSEIHDDRYERILSAKARNSNQIVKVPELRTIDRPETLFFMDIGDNWNSFPNPCCAKFFGIGGIATVKN